MSNNQSRKTFFGSVKAVLCASIPRIFAHMPCGSSSQKHLFRRLKMFYVTGSKLENEYHNLSLWYFVSFILGIVFFFQTNSNYIAGYLFNYPIYYICSIIVSISVTLIIFAKVFYKDNLLYSFIIYCFIAFLVGVFVANIRINNISTQPISRIITAKIIGRVGQMKPTLGGMQIILEDVHLLNKTNFTKNKDDPNKAETSHLNKAETSHLNKVRINIKSKLASKVKYGDVIQLKTKLFPLKNSVLPGTFDFGFYMYMSGIEASGYALTKLSIIEHNNGFFHQKIQTIRRKIYDRLISVMGQKNGNFTAAILIGETKAIPSELAQNMRNTGVSHILSVSGLHLSLVAMIFFVASRFFLNLSNYLAYNSNIKIISGFISIIGSFFYLQISGCNIAAMRAFIMTSIFIIASILGRSPHPLRSVMIAASFILIFLPEYVLHPSFQLSFSAVLCLISGYEFYLKNKDFLGQGKGVFSSIKFYVFTNIYSSLLASIVTAPFIIYHFYKFAVYSVLMNLIAVPLMSFFMMPLALASIICMPLSIDKWILKLLSWFIDIITVAANYIIELPQAILNVGSISSFSLLIFTLGFFWICIWQTVWRFIGVVIMSISLIMMYTENKPVFIYDHKIKAVGIKNTNQELEIYVEKKMPKFISNYWSSWYGQDAVLVKKRKIAKIDQLFTLPSGETISLNYWNCSEANIQIITSKKLKCKGDYQFVDNEYLWKNNQILVYCDKEKKCFVK